MHVKRRVTFHTSLVVLVIDDFTGKPVAGSSVRVFVPGKKPPVVKSDGYRIFVNLEEKEITLCCESGIYAGKKEKIKLTDRPMDGIFTFRLQPNAAYPLPENTTCITGKTKPGSRLLFWNKESRGYRLLYDYSREKDKRDIALYNPEKKELLGKGFFICGVEQEKKEFFRLEAKKKESYQMDRILPEDYKKAGSMVLPVHEICADERGDFFMPVAKGSEGEFSLCCQVEGQEYRQSFPLIPGKVNKIKL